MKKMKQVLVLIVALGSLQLQTVDLLKAEQKAETEQVETDKLEAIKKEEADWDAAMALQRDLSDEAIQKEATIEAIKKEEADWDAAMALQRDLFDAAIQAKIAKKKELELHMNNKDPLTALYEMWGNAEKAYLYIPEGDLINVDELKKTFENNHILDTYTFWYDKPWSIKTWDEAYKIFKEAQYKKPNYGYYTLYTLDELLTTLEKAKEILKGFLPLTDDFSFIFADRERTAYRPGKVYTEKNFIKKSGIRRLFTYAKLQQVITEENLTNIRLPLKFLLIKDTETGEYLSIRESLEMIDTTFKICIDPRTQCKIIPVYSDRYEFYIFAKNEDRGGRGFSKATMEQLFTLCKEAIFDIGFDNIFYDVMGNAVIIDTEYKGPDFCDKLWRYRVDESLGF